MDKRADDLREVLQSIEDGHLEATSGQQAYIAGVLHGLTGGPVPTDDSPEPSS